MLAWSGMRFVVIAGSAAVWSLAGCAVITDLSALTGGDAGSGADASPSSDGSPSDGLAADGSATDGSTADGSAADASDAGPNVNACGAALFGAPVPLANAGFETGCGGWNAYQSTLAADFGAPLAGSVACRVCATGGLDQINQKVQNLAVKVGETYEFVACVRDAPDASSIGTVTAGMGAGGSGISSLSLPISSTYQPVRVRWTATASGTLAVTVQTPDHADAGCYLVDETSLWKLDGG